MSMLISMISSSSLEDANEKRQVSFMEFQSLYNKFFNLKPEDNSFMLPELLENLINHISKVTLDNAKNKFNLRNHFVLPESPMDRFVSDLNAHPFNANRQFEPNVMEELGRRYVGNTGFNRVNTNQFCFDIESKELKLREKD